MQLHGGATSRTVVLPHVRRAHMRQAGYPSRGRASWDIDEQSRIEAESRCVRRRPRQHASCGSLPQGLRMIASLGLRLLEPVSARLARATRAGQQVARVTPWIGLLRASRPRLSAARRTPSGHRKRTVGRAALEPFSKVAASRASMSARHRWTCAMRWRSVYVFHAGHRMRTTNGSLCKSRGASTTQAVAAVWPAWLRPTIKKVFHKPPVFDTNEVYLCGMVETTVLENNSKA